MLNQQETLTEVSLGGQTINGSAQFFYALIAMTCLYGCFIGFGSAITLQANLTALAARRCVTPTHKLKSYGRAKSDKTAIEAGHCNNA